MSFNGEKIMTTKLSLISRLSVFALLVTSINFAGVALAEASPASKSSSLSEKDKTFMRKAAKAGMMEVALGRVAMQNGQSDDVKSFGKRMVADHSKANDELKSIAAKKGVKLPSKEPS
jgi:putative membrane protein